jgi:peptidoglycan/xylan/chitin deacetylase (PgdA/CDA1 family)
MKALSLVARGRGPLVVLMYHAVADTGDDPFELAVAPHRFADQVAMLTREFEVVAANDVRTPSRAPRVVITFDDGYVNLLEHAAPVLAKAGAPAAFFVNTPRDGEREMWWEEITHALEPTPSCSFLEVDIGRRIAMDVRTPEARARAVQKLGVHLETLPGDQLASVLSSAYEQLGVSPRPCERHRRMSDAEIRSLHAMGPFEIGGHTPHHLALASLDDTAALAEMTASFEHLTGLLGRPPASFAYPFGNVGHTVSRQSAVLAERAGYRQAFTTEPRAVRRWFDPYLVPRLLAPDVDAGDLRGAILEAMGR